MSKQWLRASGLALLVVLSLVGCGKKETPSLVSNVIADVDVDRSLARGAGALTSSCLQWVRYSKGSDSRDVLEFSNRSCTVGLADRASVTTTLAIRAAAPNVWTLVGSNGRSFGRITQSDPFNVAQIVLDSLCDQQDGQDTASLNSCTVFVNNGAIVAINPR